MKIQAKTYHFIQRRVPEVSHRHEDFRYHMVWKRNGPHKLLAPCSIALEKIKNLALLKSSCFMEIEVPLTCSHEPANFPYSELD
jgi:hypothetical protein